MTKRCFACMQSLVIQDKLTCSNCGYNNAEEVILDKRFLLPEQTLKNRYFLGLPMESNGESIIYVGYDTINSQKIRICEFYPNTLCKRNGNMVVPNNGMELQYKGLMTDFAELTKQLMDISKSGSLMLPLDMISENGTIYAISEFVDGVSLGKYLRENPIELTWDNIEESFMSLLYSVKTLNSNNIIHRGISLDTILITRDQEFKLKGLCTSAVRAINTEIESEFYAGYTAPEQYQKCSSHGEWTDVYGVSAVLYRILTGTTPQSAETRNPNVPIVDPLSLNSKIPDTIAGALVSGLEYNKEDRTASIKNFITDLYAQKVDVSSTQIIDTRKIEMQMKPNEQYNQQTNQAPQQNFQENNYEFNSQQPPQKVKQKKRRRKFRIPVWFIVIVITLPTMLWGFGKIYEQALGFNPFDDILESIFGSEVLEDELLDRLDDELTVPTLPPVEEIPTPPAAEPEQETSTEMCVVEDFRGKFYDFILETQTYTNMFTFTKREVFNDSAPIGEVVEQSISPNELVTIGKEIELIVSKGKKLVLLPATTDEYGTPIHITSYENALASLGISYKIELIDSLMAQSSFVDSTSIVPGSMINREVDGPVTVYVAR